MGPSGFEYAAQPGVSDKEKAEKLHFAVVGGGPTVRGVNEWNDLQIFSIIIKQIFILPRVLNSRQSYMTLLPRTSLDYIHSLWNTLE